MDYVGVWYVGLSTGIGGNRGFVADFSKSKTERGVSKYRWPHLYWTPIWVVVKIVVPFWVP